MKAKDSWAWKRVYAGRVMEVTRKPYKDALRQAGEAQIIYQDWNKFHPRELADRRMRLYRK